MKWRQPADRNVVEAVLDVFRDPLSIDRESGCFEPGLLDTVIAQERDRTCPRLTQQNIEAQFAKLTLRQWQRSLYWLDVSGLALYFLIRLRDLNHTHAIPPEILTRLQTNLADSQGRVRSMFAEFAALNTLFADAGMLFCNLKGFTLSPDSCPDPALRCQLDFDFLIDGADIDRCRAILEARGYTLRGESTGVLEFKTHSDKLAVIGDLYRAKPQHAVEIHFCTDATGTPTRDPRLNRIHTLHVMGLNVPALSPVDQFLGQATHLLGHLCGAHTRIAWLLEFTTHMLAHVEDDSFWHGVREASAGDERTSIALSLCTQLATQLFLPELAHAQTPVRPSTLEARCASWATRYGRRALLADTPGTKLGLLLKDELHLADPTWAAQKRVSLVPRHRAPRLLPVNRSDSLSKRLRSEILQLRYDLFRLRFHIVEGARYLYESYHWRRTFNTPNLPLSREILTVRESRPS